MPDISKLFIYRMTHLQNISHILQYGITHATSPERNNSYISIGDSSLIGRRHNIRLPFGKKLGSYIPFYFGPRMPMLYVIQNGYSGVTVIPASDIVYCISTVEAIERHGLGYIFSDGHALDALTSFYDRSAIHRFNELVDMQAVKSKYWNDENDLDLKRRKEAEFLVAENIPPEAIIGFVVFNAEVKRQLGNLPGITNKQVSVKPGYYFSI